MNTNNPQNKLGKALIWILVLIIALSFASLACDEGNMQNTNSSTGDKVGAGMTEGNPVSDNTSSFMCAFNDGSNPNWDKQCQ